MKARRHTSLGHIVRYTGTVRDGDWMLDIQLWTNEPDGEPRFEITGRTRVKINGDIASSDPRPARSERLERLARADIDKYRIRR